MSSKESNRAEKEAELIEMMAKKIAGSDFAFFALFILQTVKPISWIAGELAYFYLAPFLPLLEEKGYDFLDTFEKRENIESLIRKIEVLVEEKKKEDITPTEKHDKSYQKIYKKILNKIILFKRVKE